MAAPLQAVVAVDMTPILSLRVFRYDDFMGKMTNWIFVAFGVVLSILVIRRWLQGGGMDVPSVIILSIAVILLILFNLPSEED